MLFIHTSKENKKEKNTDPFISYSSDFDKIIKILLKAYKL